MDGWRRAPYERRACDDYAPDVVRFGLSPLYHRYADIWALGERLRQLETVRMQ